MDDQKALQLAQLIQALDAIPFNHMLGLRLESHTRDNISMVFAMKPELIGNYIQGILHGGVTSSVLDMTGGVAAMVSVLYRHPPAEPLELNNIVGKTRTVDLKISYLRPGVGTHFIAKARTLRTGRKICFTSMELFNEKDVMIASGSGTYLIG